MREGIINMVLHITLLEAVSGIYLENVDRFNILFLVYGASLNLVLLAADILSIQLVVLIET